MTYDIRELTPDLAEDYIRFFETEDHSDEIPEHKCYCVCWASADHRGDRDLMSTAEKRKRLAYSYVKEGRIQGYLAYDGDRVIGWVHANDTRKCIHSISWLRIRKDVLVDDTKDQKIKSIFCFTIAKAYRRTGVASALLQAVLEDAAKRGYDAVEAYPKRTMPELDAFEGPLAMYLKNQFTVTSEHKEFLVVRKQLL
jgi:GNAT superfamily N-acetyltransferase